MYPAAIPDQDFQKCFQQWKGKNQWIKCKEAQEVYFEDIKVKSQKKASHF